MEDNVAAELLAQERLNQAIALRVKGAHWIEIAQRCGYPNARAALRAVGDAMAAATLRSEESADMMRDTANLRLENLLSETLLMLSEDPPHAYDEDGNPLATDDRAVRLRAVDEARRLIADIAKMNGVDKPAAAGPEAVPMIRIIGLDPMDVV